MDFCFLTNPPISLLATILSTQGQSFPLEKLISIYNSGTFIWIMANQHKNKYRYLYMLFGKMTIYRSVLVLMQQPSWLL